MLLTHLQKNAFVWVGCLLGACLDIGFSTNISFAQLTGACHTLSILRTPWQPLVINPTM